VVKEISGISDQFGKANKEDQDETKNAQKARNLSAEDKRRILKTNEEENTGEKASAQQAESREERKRVSTRHERLVDSIRGKLNELHKNLRRKSRFCSG